MRIVETKLATVFFGVDLFFALRAFCVVQTRSTVANVFPSVCKLHTMNRIARIAGHISSSVGQEPSLGTLANLFPPKEKDKTYIYI